MAQRVLSDAELPAYLRERGWVADDEPIQCFGAGDGNINWVRRVCVGGCRARSFVVKQARPALERFPQYAAPTERIVCEARWLELASSLDAEGVCPRVHAFDEAERVLALEDLSHWERLDARLARGVDDAVAVSSLARLLARVHRTTAGRPELAERFANAAMQRLHGDHIFQLPYTEDFGLPEPVSAAARAVRGDAELCAIAAAARRRYETPAGALVHGDVQAGNVLVRPDGGAAKLLDAEIAHVGDPAFDLGTLLAHLALPALARGEAPSPLVAQALRAYAEAGGRDEPEPALRYAGLELVRRTIGAARVPAVELPDAALRVLRAGIAWVRAPESVRLAAA
jgi:5-methylthioribose kinase